MDAALVFVFPDGEQRVVPLGGADGQRVRVTVGRAEENDVEIEHPVVSRHHLELLRTNEQATDWMALDPGSANGTWRNGETLLAPGAAVSLRDGDCLAFSSAAVTVRAVYVVDPPAAGRAGLFRSLTRPGAILAGRYVLKENLGGTEEFQGYRATDTQTGNGMEVSLKLFALDAVSAEDFPALVARVDRLSASPSHPGIVRCLIAGRTEGLTYAASRWVDGFPALDLLRARGALTPTEALQLLRPAAAACDHVAEHGAATLDLSLRPTLLAFRLPLSLAAWDEMRRTPLGGWPSFTPRFTVALLAPRSEVGGRVHDLARFACELLGHPLPDGAIAKLPRAIHPSLGEAGNQVLRLALGAGTSPGTAAFATGEEFVAELVKSAGLEAALATVP